MPIDDGRPGAGVTPSRRGNLRRRIAVGVVAAAAIAGAGAYAITSRVTADDPAASRNASALVPAVSDAPSFPAASAVPSLLAATTVPSASASAGAVSPSATVPKGSASLSPEVRKKVNAVRSAGAKAHQRVTKPLPAPSKVVPDSAVATRVKETKESYLRVTTARTDLTDQKDHRMAADDGKKIGEVNCTQRFHFAANVKPKVIPNMMICWRISARRSVVTVGVTHTGKPSPSTYASVIRREWAKLG